jgi:hypothetical protein
MNRIFFVLLGSSLLVLPGLAIAQAHSDLLTELTRPHEYTLKRVSSYDRTGGNDDYRPLAAGETLTLLDEAGPGEISHVWITIASNERFHLKKIVLHKMGRREFAQRRGTRWRFFRLTGEYRFIIPCRQWEVTRL